MPFVLEKRAATPNLRGVLGPCAGSASDFVALMYCPDLDAAEQEANPDHGSFTHVVRWQNGQRLDLARYPARLDGLAQISEGRWIAVGDCAGTVQISKDGVVEVPISGSRGIHTAVWAAGEACVITVGSDPAFIAHRKHGEWTALALPPDALGFQDVTGLAEDDVYIVGDRGQVHHFDGARVTRLRVPAQRPLTCAVKLDDRRICIGGYGGTLLIGSTAGWRRIDTGTHVALLSVAALSGYVYFAADGGLWTTDGNSPVASVRSFEGDWVCGLADAIVLVDATRAWLHSHDGLVELDTSVRPDDPEGA